MRVKNVQNDQAALEQQLGAIVQNLDATGGHAAAIDATPAVEKCTRAPRGA